MSIVKVILSSFCFIICSCGQKARHSKVDVNVARLSNKIVPLVNFLDNPDSCKKALLFLDSATAIDNSCFLCYYNKLMFLYPLKQYGKAVEAINNCIRLNPSGHDLYLTGGILYDKMGDSIHSSNYFHKSLTICNAVLDTMDVKSVDYGMLTGSKAINLIMLGKDREANELLKKLYANQTNIVSQELIKSLMNKTKMEIVDRMTNSQSIH